MPVYPPNDNNSIIRRKAMPSVPTFSTYDILLFAVIAVFILALIAQERVQSTYKKYSRIPTRANVSASNVAFELLRRSGSSATIARTAGSLTDNFNPRTGVVSLSEPVFNSSSVAAVAVAAHEIGHVMQYEEGYGPIKLRNAILPVAQIGSSAAPFIVIIGMFFGSYTLSMVGVYLFAAVLLFQVATLPVEINASRRALEMLSANGYIAGDETTGARKVLRAAAMTYVVAALATIVSLFRLLAIANNSRRG